VPVLHQAQQQAYYLLKMPPPLIIFSGLPATGKTTIARKLAHQIGAVYVRIDSIEQAIRDSGVIPDSVDDAGYRVGYSIAEDNLRLGRTVIADSVNPLRLTRDAWVNVADRSGTSAIEVEITCSDRQEHRLRAETRIAEVAGLGLPTWQEIVARDYDSWSRVHITIDTAGASVDESVQQLRNALAK